MIHSSAARLPAAGAPLAAPGIAAIDHLIVTVDGKFTYNVDELEDELCEFFGARAGRARAGRWPAPPDDFRPESLGF